MKDGVGRRDPGAGPQGSGGGCGGEIGNLFASWEGMTNKINTPDLKSSFSKLLVFKF